MLTAPRQALNVSARKQPRTRPAGQFGDRRDLALARAHSLSVDRSMPSMSARHRGDPIGKHGSTMTHVWGRVKRIRHPILPRCLRARRIVSDDAMTCPADRGQVRMPQHLRGCREVTTSPRGNRVAYRARNLCAV